LTYYLYAFALCFGKKVKESGTFPRSISLKNKKGSARNYSIKATVTLLNPKTRVASAAVLTYPIAVRLMKFL